MYESVHAALAEKIPLPNLVVYLRAETDVLMERIAFRDRVYERDIDRDYIDSLNRAYEEFFLTYDDSPVLAIDTDNINIVRNKEDLAYVIGQIHAALAGFRQPRLPEVSKI
jgi:deoxyguanosine kinase